MQKRRYSSDEHSACATDERPGLVARACATVIHAYQLLIRPLLPPSCRYVPSCSEYARRAVLVHGLRRGGRLAVGRVIRCNAWHPGGLDPVPGTEA